MSGKVLVTVEITAMTCPSCGVTYGIDEAIRLRKKRDGGDWYCTNGHSIHYTRPEAERLRGQLTKAQDAIARAEADARWWRDCKAVEERAHAATRGQLTKARRRIANGTCPCCKRHFVNLERHMSGQHPDYAEMPA